MMKTLGMTHAVCGKCGALAPAKIVWGEEGIFFNKHCAEDGEESALVSADPKDFLDSQRFVKPASIPLRFAGDAELPCPDGCGFCSRHEQHLCLPIIEITTRCDLQCPICLVEAGGDPWDMPLDAYRRILEGLIRTERQINVLNLSGGEPLRHPGLLRILDETLSRPEIVRVSLSTNGLALLENSELVRNLRQRDVLIALQFDGFHDKAYRTLRGRPLLEQKLRILDVLEANRISTSLTMTLAGGVNEDQLPGVLECLFARDHISSLMIQPLAFAGRAAALCGTIKRLGIPDVLRLLDGADPRRVAATDFVPLPCSHPHCFSLAFFLALEGGKTMPVNRLIGAEPLLDSVSNQVFFGMNAQDYERLKDLVYGLWSGPAGTDPQNRAVLKTLREILLELSDRSSQDARAVFRLGEHRLKSIFIHAFQDAETFDLARARRCCNAYPQEDGKLIPACVRNVYRRRDSGTPAAGPPE